MAKNKSRSQSAQFESADDADTVDGGLATAVEERLAEPDPPQYAEPPADALANTAPAVAPVDTGLTAEERYLCEVEHYVLLTKRNGAQFWSASVYGGVNTGRVLRDDIASKEQAAELFAGFDLRIEEPAR